ncbi:hypothetical protein DICPUDRAFT_150241 [Dictyostelium purpureum]|uniref:Uncharacterized protein n=1 Tax=Dictyostelium purpureum TaxID=5786 RepID=F0ZFT9_DICPU|nr:uncharacterized protein DICPUDRAFT_150241 [Dictyostelium purpureum]EGC37213.1 hypothetical protein DICPUDRAFT_150241 [Dictyostelium purpureum]|eukprot:XP_003286264.1 hypothetical protein DICPUDRAFT_150241 [Dictyostelium purpureum]
MNLDNSSNNNNNKDGVCSFSSSSSNNQSTINEDLSKKKCVPCEGDIPPLDEKSKKTYLEKVHKGNY